MNMSHVAHQTHRDRYSWRLLSLLGVNFRTKPEAGSYRYECLAAKEQRAPTALNSTYAYLGSSLTRPSQ